MSDHECADRRRNFCGMRLEREVSCVEKADCGVGNVFFEGLRPGRQEEGVVLTPNRQQAGLVSSEVLLERWIEGYIRLVVTEEVQLHLVGARSRQVEVVE